MVQYANNQFTNHVLNVPPPTILLDFVAIHWTETMLPANYQCSIVAGYLSIIFKFVLIEISFPFLHVNSCEKGKLLMKETTP
jgi:hypothetical protein